MKKIAFLLFAVVLFCASCSKNSNICNINGKLEADGFDGKYVYLYDNVAGAIIDSAIVEDGSFAFSREIETATIATIFSDKVKEMSFKLKVIMEPGDITCDIINDALSGTAHNNAYGNFIKAGKDVEKKINDAYEAVKNAPEEEQEAEMEKFENFYERTIEEYQQTAISFYNDNKDNISGALGIIELFDIDEEMNLGKINSLLEGADESIINYPSIQKQIASMQKREATAVGSKYIDLDIIDFKTGKAAKLSDYAEGKITLVDFWASWCGPCRREIPNVANIYNKYADKGVVVISLNVWDEQGAQAQAIENMNMNWIQLTDTTGNSTDTYGIRGIPHIMLIGANGTILARDLREDAIEESVIKALEE